jgi:hypothetical protein
VFGDKPDINYEDFKPLMLELMGLPSYFSVLVFEKLGKTPKDKITKQ